MPTTNDRGFPLYSSGESMPGWAAAYNAQSNALSTALDASEATAKNDDSVELIADLPVTDNWIGRRIFVEEDKSLRVLETLPAVWMIAYRAPLIGTIDWEPGWSAEPGNSVERTADHVVVTFNGEKTSAVVSMEIVGYLPVGFRPGTVVYCSGSYHGTGNPGPTIVTVDTTGEIRIFFGGVATQTKLAFTVIFPI